MNEGLNKIVETLKASEENFHGYLAERRRAANPPAAPSAVPRSGTETEEKSETDLDANAIKAKQRRFHDYLAQRRRRK